MAGENTVTTLSGFFYEIYAEKLADAKPKAVKIQQDVKFKEGKRLGGTYHQPVLLKFEQGFTYAAAGTDNFSLDAAVPSESQDAQIVGTQMVLRSRVGYEAAARAATSKQVFRAMTENLIENMWDANKRRLEIMCLYGQDSIGKVASVASNVITITTAEWAPGIWSGMEGAVIVATTTKAASTTLRAGNMTITAVDLDARTVTVDAAATGLAANDFLWFKTEKTATAHTGFVGVASALDTSGTVFNIDNSAYSLWKATEYDVSSAALTFQKVNKAVAKAMGKGLDDDICLYINPSTWADLLDNEVALRRHGEGGRSMYKVGANGIEFYTQTGMILIKASTFVKEGYGYLIAPELWQRIGATDITFRLPNSPAGFNEFFLHDASTTAYELRTYSNQAMFTKALGKATLLNNIVNAA